jgi:hypothetical protein
MKITTFIAAGAALVGAAVFAAPLIGHAQGAPASGESLFNGRCKACGRSLARREEGDRRLSHHPGRRS